MQPRIQSREVVAVDIEEIVAACPVSIVVAGVKKLPAPFIIPDILDNGYVEDRMVSLCRNCM